MTPAKMLLCQQLRAERLQGYPFHTNRYIARFVVDFCCHKAALMVEMNGESPMEQKAYHRERDLFLHTCPMTRLPPEMEHAFPQTSS